MWQKEMRASVHNGASVCLAVLRCRPIHCRTSRSVVPSWVEGMVVHPKKRSGELSSKVRCGHSACIVSPCTCVRFKKFLSDTGTASVTEQPNYIMPCFKLHPILIQDNLEGCVYPLAFNAWQKNGCDSRLCRVWWCKMQK